MQVIVIHQISQHIRQQSRTGTASGPFSVVPRTTLQPRQQIAERLAASLPKEDRFHWVTRRESNTCCGVVLDEGESLAASRQSEKDND